MSYRKHRSASSAAVLCMAGVLWACIATAQETAQPGDTAPRQSYLIQAGDLLQVSVWKEDYLERDVLVRPDGGISFPLAGDVAAANRTVIQIRDTLAQQLSRYIPDPVVTVAVKQINGNKIYILGQVQRPGTFVMNPRVDVMQALAMAGGATPFAAVNDIKILRRTGGDQEVIDFRYGDVERGRRLEQNVMLESGDIIVVP
jgi:polysaccharide export outer membrane protein